MAAPGEVSRPLEWEGRPASALVRLAAPIAVSMLSYSAMTVVGTAFVGRLGPAQLAGVGVAGVYVFALLCFAFGLFRGLKVLVSQSVGAGRREDAGRSLAAGLVWALGLGVLALFASRWMAELLPLLTASGDAGEFARQYLSIRTLAAPAVLAACALREVRQGLGDSRSSMVASLSANATNAALDWVLLVELGWGVPGAAWAAVAGHGVDCAVLAFIHWRKGPRLARPSSAELLAVWALGFPIAVQFALEVGSFALVSAMLAGMGDVQIAAHQVTLHLIQFSFLPALALGEAGSVLVGQAVGAGREDRVMEVARLAMKLAMGYGAFCAAVFVLAGSPLLWLFTQDPALHDVALRLLFVGAAFQLADGVAITARCALRGTGDVQYAAWTGVVISWLLLPPLTYLLGIRLGWGALGGWVAIFLEVAVGAALFWRRLHVGGWRGPSRAARALRERTRGEAVSVPVPAEG